MSKPRSTALHRVFRQVITDPDFQVSQGEDENSVVVEGRAARYSNWFQVWGMFGGSTEIWRRNNPGMFARSLAQSPDVIHALNHEQALSRTHAGSLQLWEDEEGLLFRSTLNLDMPSAMECYQGVKSKLYEQASVKYVPSRMEEWSEQKDGKQIYYEDVLEGNLNKGDVTTAVWGANPRTNTNLVQSLEEMLASAGARVFAQQILDGYDDGVAATDPAEQVGPVAPSQDADAQSAADGREAVRERARALVRVNENQVTAQTYALRARGLTGNHAPFGGEESG